MRFHYDLTQATPIMREYPVYDVSDSGLVAGQAVSGSAINATEGKGCMIDAAAADPIAVIGVLASTSAHCLSVLATGVEYYGKAIVNPHAIYLAEWEQSGGTNTAANATGETITCTIAANAEANWFYVYGSDGNTAQGNLFKAGNDSNTATAINVTGTAFDDELGALTTASTFINIVTHLIGGITTGSVDMNSDMTKLSGAADATGGDMLILENYINSKRFPFEPLKVANHCGKKDASAKFYGDLFFVKSIFSGNGTLV